MPNIAALLQDVKKWAAGRPDLVGLALVGSRARGTERPDSDVDLVLLCSEPQRLLETDWFSQFGRVRAVNLESYGALRSFRVLYEHGAEVEFGVAGRDWARLPLDPGTKQVLLDGVRILHDPEHLLRAARDAAVRSS